MIVHYQPSIEIATHDVVRVEVLMRFPGGSAEMQDLTTFIPHAERFGLIGELTETVVTLALEEFRSYGFALPLAFNVSRLDLDDGAFFDRTLAQLDRARVDPHAITFELSDGIQAMDDGLGLETLRRLRASGVRIAVDGFGPTLSTFSHLELERVGIDEVKIDAGALRDTAYRSTVRGVVELCRSLHIAVVAKGVESPERLLLVGELGCGFAQGYEIARPMPADDLIRWLETQHIAEGGMPELCAPVPRAAPKAMAERSFLRKLFGR